MEWTTNMEGGGNLYLRDDGSYLYFEAKRNNDQKGIYKVVIQGLNGSQVLGTMSPSEEGLKLTRMVSRQTLSQWGCLPVTKAICQQTYTFSEEHKGYPSFPQGENTLWNEVDLFLSQGNQGDFLEEEEFLQNRGTIEEINREKIEEINREKIEEINRGKIEEINRGKIEELNREKIGELNRGKIEELNREKIGEINRGKIEELNRGKIEELNREKIEELNREKIGELNREKIGEINRGKIEELNREKIGEINRGKIEEINGEKIGEINRGKIGEINREKIEEINREKIGEINRKKIGEINRGKIEELNRDKTGGVYKERDEIVEHGSFLEEGLSWEVCEEIEGKTLDKKENVYDLEELWLPVEEENESFFPSAFPVKGLRDKLLMERFLSCSGLLREDRINGFSLAIPYIPDKEFKLTSLFCFAYLQELKGNYYLVFSFTKEGVPTFL